MATNTSIQMLARNVPSLDTGVYSISKKPVLPVVAAAGDSVTLLTMPHSARILSAHLRQGANVGAGVTLKLQKNSGGTRTDLTASTTAATAGVVSSIGLLPVDIAPGDTIEVLVSGAQNAAVAIEYDIQCQHA
jgi:hypothetical protein